MNGFRYPGASQVQEVPKDAHTLEEIWWWDHYCRSAQWGTPEDSEGMLNHPPLLMRTVGWVVAENAGQVMLAQTVSHYTDGDVQNVDNRWVILKDSIVNRWEIR